MAETAQLHVVSGLVRATPAGGAASAPIYCATADAGEQLTLPFVLLATATVGVQLVWQHTEPETTSPEWILEPTPPLSDAILAPQPYPQPAGTAGTQFVSTAFTAPAGEYEVIMVADSARKFATIIVGVDTGDDCLTWNTIE